MYDLITVGSATYDVFAQTDNEVIDIKTNSSEESLIAFPLGSKIIIKKINFEIGGGGTNTAVAASRLGLKTAYLGNLGNDEHSRLIQKLLKKENVDFIGTTSKDITNYSIILDSISHDRTILVYKGASEKYMSKQIPKAKYIYLCAMINDAYKQLEKTAKLAKKNNTKIVFNPSSYLAKKGATYLKNILNITDYLILNLEEARLITKKQKEKDIISSLKKLGPKNIIITNGGENIITYYKKKLTYFTPKKITPLETTGAGDAFGSTFISMIIKGKPLKAAVELALKNSQSVIKDIGAKKGLLRL